MSQCRAKAGSNLPTLVVSIMPLNQEATGCRDLQAAQRNKLKTRKLVRTCQAEIASGGVLMAIRMRKTILSAMIDTITADSRQYTSHASASPSLTSRAAESPGRKKIRNTSIYRRQ